MILDYERCNRVTITQKEREAGLAGSPFRLSLIASMGEFVELTEYDILVSDFNEARKFAVRPIEDEPYLLTAVLSHKGNWYVWTTVKIEQMKQDAGTAYRVGRYRTDGKGAANVRQLMGFPWTESPIEIETDTGWATLERPAAGSIEWEPVKRSEARKKLAGILAADGRSQQAADDESGSIVREWFRPGMYVDDLALFAI